MQERLIWLELDNLIAETTRPPEDVQMKEAGGEGEPGAETSTILSLSDELYCTELKSLQFGRGFQKKMFYKV